MCVYNTYIYIYIDIDIYTYNISLSLSLHIYIYIYIYTYIIRVLGDAARGGAGLGERDDELAVGVDGGPDIINIVNFVIIEHVYTYMCIHIHVCVYTYIERDIVMYLYKLVCHYLLTNV